MKTFYTKTITILLLLFIFSTSFAQNIVNGVITNSQKNPLEGANIVIKGTTYNTTSDSSGKFTIDTQEKLPLTLISTIRGI